MRLYAVNYGNTYSMLSHIYKYASLCSGERIFKGIDSNVQHFACFVTQPLPSVSETHGHRKLVGFYNNDTVVLISPQSYKPFALIDRITYAYIYGVQLV